MAIKSKVVNLTWIFLGASFIGPLIYGLFYCIALVSLDAFVSPFQLGQLRELIHVLVYPFILQFLFLASFFMEEKGFRHTLLPTFLAAFSFWFFNWQFFKNSTMRSNFWFVLFEAVMGSFLCVAAYLVVNPIFITPGVDALYFYKYIAEVDPYAEWGTHHDFGQLFHLTLLALIGFCLGAIHTVFSVRDVRTNAV